MSTKKPKRRDYEIADYVARKVAHMQRSGIGGSIHMGAARPSWKDEQTKTALTFERNEVFVVRDGRGNIVERWTCSHPANKGRPPRFRVQRVGGRA